MFLGIQAFLLDHSNSPQQTDLATRILRTDLNKHLGKLNQDI